MSTKFTLGPWSVGRLRRSSFSQLSHPEVPVHVGALGVGGGPGNALAIVYLGGPGAIQATEEAVMANARLIAAAPEMYTSLQELYAILLNGMQYDYDDMTAALGRARVILARIDGEKDLT